MLHAVHEAPCSLATTGAHRRWIRSQPGLRGETAPSFALPCRSWLRPPRRWPVANAENPASTAGCDVPRQAYEVGCLVTQTATRDVRGWQGAASRNSTPCLPHMSQRSQHLEQAPLGGKSRLVRLIAVFGAFAHLATSHCSRAPHPHSAARGAFSCGNFRSLVKTGAGVQVWLQGWSWCRRRRSRRRARAVAVACRPRAQGSHASR